MYLKTEDRRIAHARTSLVIFQHTPSSEAMCPKALPESEKVSEKAKNKNHHVKKREKHSLKPKIILQTPQGNQQLAKLPYPFIDPCSSSGRRIFGNKVVSRHHNINEERRNGTSASQKGNNGVRGIRPPSRQITTNDDGDGGEYNDSDLRQSGFGPGGKWCSA